MTSGYVEMQIYTQFVVLAISFAGSSAMWQMMSHSSALYQIYWRLVGRGTRLIFKYWQ